MPPGRVRRLLSRLVGTPRKIQRRLGRLRAGERYASLIEQCSDRDGTDSSEFTGIDHVIFPTQVNDFTQSGGDEALVAGQLLPVPLGAREEAGDPHLSVCVHSSIPCGEQYSKLESDGKAEIVKVTPQDTQKGGPIVTTLAAYSSHLENEDGYLGDRESSKDGESDDSASNLGDRESRDGDSDDYVSDLGERDPADGAECLLPLKDERSLGKNENLDKCNNVPQIPEELPKAKKLSASELQYNMQDYLNMEDQTRFKQSPQKDLQKFDQLSRTLPLPLPPSLSSPLPTPPQSPLVPSQHIPPEKSLVRAPHKRKRQSSISTATKIPKKCNRKQQGKKQKFHKKKKRHQRGRIVNCGNSVSKAHSFGFASHSQGQSHASNKGSGSVCIGQVTGRERCLGNQDGSSSSSSSGGKKSSKSSKSETDSSSSSSSGGKKSSETSKSDTGSSSTSSDYPKKKRHPEDKELKPSSGFETSEYVFTSAANMKGDSSVTFVSGSELELSSKPEDKASDRESLSSFTSPKAKQKSIKKHESKIQQTLSPPAIGDLPPVATADSQPAGIDELQPADIDDSQPAGIGGLPPTGTGGHQPGDLPPFWIPFRSLAEEEPVTQPLLSPSTLTHGLRALLVHDGIMPIQVHDGIMPIQVHQEPIEVFLEVCAVGDHQLLLSAVKVLGAVLYCKLCFINCGQPSVRILPAISVLCPEGCEWSLAVNVTACYAGTPETFRSFAMEIVRLLSILLVKWETFHTTEVILQTVERESLRLISLLQRVKSMIEGAFSQHDPIPLHLLHYLVERLLIPNM